MCMAVSKKDLQCTIGKNIRDARKTCGYTKEVLAEKAEISVEHITQVERGDKMMSVPSLVRRRPRRRRSGYGYVHHGGD